MAIEINTLSNLPSAANTVSGQVAATGSGSGGGTPAPAAGSGADTVSITSRSRRLQALESRLQQIPVTDARRVDSIRQSLGSGGYQVDAAAVADKLIQFELALANG